MEGLNGFDHHINEAMTYQAVVLGDACSGKYNLCKYVASDYNELVSDYVVESGSAVEPRWICGGQLLEKNNISSYELYYVPGRASIDRFKFPFDKGAVRTVIIVKKFSSINIEELKLWINKLSKQFEKIVVAITHSEIYNEAIISEYIFNLYKLTEKKSRLLCVCMVNLDQVKPEFLCETTKMVKTSIKLLRDYIKG